MNMQLLITLLLFRTYGESMFELVVDEVEWTSPLYYHQN